MPFKITLCALYNGPFLGYFVSLNNVVVHTNSVTSISNTKLVKCIESELRNTEKERVLAGLVYPHSF